MIRELKKEFIQDVEFLKEMKKSATLVDVAETILLSFGLLSFMILSSILFLIIL